MIRAFTSIDELNKYLADELGLPPLPADAVEEGIAAARVANGMGADDEVVARFSFETPDAPEVEAPDTTSLDSYIEFSTKQLSLVIRERDAAQEEAAHWQGLAQQEHEAHHECHENMAAAIQQIRTQGYAEAIAAGLFPHQPVETLPAEVQEAIMRQAHSSIEAIDKVRAGLGTAQAKPTTH